MELHVGRFHFRIGLEEAARIAGTDREKALAQQRVTQAGGDAAAHHVIHGVARIAAVVEARLIVVLQVGADALHVGNHLDPMLGEQIGGTGSRELQQLRRIEIAPREEHPSCGELNAPLERITSALARAVCVPPSFLYSTPTARRSSNRMRVVSAWETT